MKQKGFTLIELVVVIVILGILAATALPKFIDLSSDARKAAADGIAGALASGASINYAKFAISSGAASVVSVTDCASAAGTLAGGIDATKYTVTTTVACAGGPPKTATCTVADNVDNTKFGTTTIVCTN